MSHTARGMSTPMKRKLLAATGVAALAAAVLTGCASGSAEAEAASCTNEIKVADATQVSVWAWYPAFEEVVDLFNETHDDVQICWTNAGQGNDEYTKFSTVDRGGLRCSGRHHARVRGALELRDPQGARRPHRVRRRRGEGRLHRGRLEGRLQRRRGLRDPGRRRPDGHALPPGHLRRVRHRRPDHVGRVRRRGAGS